VNEAAPDGLVPSDTYPFLAEGLFSTLTNVNFDPDALVAWVQECAVRRDALKAVLAKKGRAVDFTESPASFMPAATAELVAKKGESTASTRSPAPTSTCALYNIRSCTG